MRLTLSYLLLCLSLLCNAQSQKTINPVGWKGSSIQLHTIGNGSRNCTFIVNDDSIKAFLHDSVPASVALFTVPRIPLEAFLGGIVKQNEVILFMNNGKRPGIHTWKYNLLDHSIAENVVPFEIKENKILQRLSAANYFFYFTANYKKNEFVIYKFSNEKDHSVFNVTIAGSVWDNLLKYNTGLFSKAEINMEKTDMEGECNVEAAQCPNKLYVQGDTLRLLMDYTANTTEVHTINLSTEKETISFIKHGNRIQPSVYNSFLNNNTLYYAAASTEGIYVEITDFYSGKIKNNFFAGYEEEINFKNTPIIQESGGIINNRELDKTNQLLRKMLKGTIFITATPYLYDTTVSLMVGSYKPVYSNGGGMWLPVGGVTAGGISYFVTIPTGGFSRGNGMKTANFKMLVDEKAKHITGNLPPTINDKIETYTEHIKIPSDGENLFRIGHSYYYAYYDKRERSFMITRFDH